MPERNKSKLYQRLESVADTYHKTIALVQHLLHRLGDFRGAEKGVDEFGRALRLVAAAEAARLPSIRTSTRA